MKLTSIAYAKLADIYFPLALIPQTTGQAKESGDLPDIEKYIMQIETEAGTEWALDIQHMAGDKYFRWFFSSDSARLTAAEWENINRRLCGEQPRPKGGLLQPFVEMEDDRFVSLLNSIPSGHTFERKTEQGFSIPHNFFEALESMGIYIEYDREEGKFICDFSAMIRNFNPNSIYNAYQRYAHAEYTRISFGIKESPHEKGIKELRRLGNKKIQDELGDNVEWDLVEDALQVFPNRNPYKLSIIEEVKKDVVGQIAKKKKMGLEESIFDHNDIVNISNAWNDLSALIISGASSRKEKAEIEQAGLVVKVQLLYKTIAKNQKLVNNRRAETIEALYRKWRMSKADSPETIFDTGSHVSADVNDFGDTDGWAEADSGKEYKIDPDLLYKSPEKIFFDKEVRRKFIISLFDEEFKGSGKFLNALREFVMDESKRHLNLEIYRYRKIGKHNINSELYKLFCSTNAIDPKSKEGKRIHLQFADSVERIADTLYTYDNNEEAV